MSPPGAPMDESCNHANGTHGKEGPSDHFMVINGKVNCPGNKGDSN